MGLEGRGNILENREETQMTRIQSDVYPDPLTLTVTS